MMVWGDDAEKKVLDNQNKICAAFYDEEKSDVKSITSETKKEVAEVTQLTVADVQDVLRKYKQLADFH